MSATVVRPVPSLEVGPCVVAKGHNFRVLLLPLSVRELSDFRAPSASDMLCLNIHEAEVPQVIRELRHFHDSCLDGESNIAPCVFVLGNLDWLSGDELWTISQEMESAGGIFQAWPDGCASFAEAFNALAKDISRTYGSIENLPVNTVANW